MLAQDDFDQLTQLLTHALQAGGELPHANEHGLTKDLDTAYRVQRQVVNNVLAGAAPPGFKAGLTAAGAQQMFGVDHPLFGVLLNKGVLDSADGPVTLKRSEFFNPLLEMEIGYRLREPVSEPLPDVATLRSLVAEVLPVIEVPDLAFGDLKRVHVVDVVAIDVGAHSVVLGAPLAPDAVDVEQIDAALKRDGELLTTGPSADAMGNQWQALLWVVNAAVANGWTIEPGQVLITGAMGKVLPAQPGNYAAEFGELGRIEFAVQ